MSAKNVTITVSGNVVATAGFIKWIQGTNTTYTVSVDTQTDYITVTDSAASQATTIANDTLWAAAGDILYATANDTGAVLSKGTAGQVLQIGASAPSWVNNFTDVTFSSSGTLATGTGAFRWYNTTGRTLTFNTVVASVGTAPASQSILCDVNVDGSTIWATQGNRVAVAAAANTGTATSFDTTTIATAHYITVDIDQVGTGTTGSNLTVQIWLTG